MSMRPKITSRFRSLEPLVQDPGLAQALAPMTTQSVARTFKKGTKSNFKFRTAKFYVQNRQLQGNLAYVVIAKNKSNCS